MTIYLKTKLTKSWGYVRRVRYESPSICRRRHGYGHFGKTYQVELFFSPQNVSKMVDMALFIVVFVPKIYKYDAVLSCPRFGGVKCTL